MSNSNDQALQFFGLIAKTSCHCMLIKMINYDEIIANGESTSQTMSILADIVKDTFSTIGIDLNFCLLDDRMFMHFQMLDAARDPTLVRKIAFDIYTKLQLNVDDILKTHINIIITSLNFPEDCSDYKQIFPILTGILIDNSHHYYQNYQDAKQSLERLRQKNHDLTTLKQALNAKKVKFVYQPIVDRKTGEVPYYECLLRILDDNNQSSSIGPLIITAEANGLINIIDMLALNMVVDELVKDPEISLSVNISNCGILNEYLLQKAEELLKTHNVAHRLIIEVTETILNLDFEKTKKFMNRLRKYGCKFALDDFGAGFTSFKQLQNLPIDIVKIDGSYIKNIISNHQSKYFVEALIKISEDLGIKTVAEFVENGEIAKFLIDIKIDGMQGNFFSPASSNKVS